MRIRNLGMGAIAAALFWMPSAKASNSSCDTTPGQLVINCGFELSNFNNWTLTGTDVGSVFAANLYGVEPGMDPDGTTPHSGTYQAFFADPQNTIRLSQTISTITGSSYTFSWWLAQDTLTPPAGCCGNSLTVTFGGNAVNGLANAVVPMQGYTMYSTTLIAVSTNTTISFTFLNQGVSSSQFQLGEFLLDDVSVTQSAAPEPASWLLVASGAFAGLALFWRKRNAQCRASVN